MIAGIIYVSPAMSLSRAMQGKAVEYHSIVQAPTMEALDKLPLPASY